MSAYNPACLVDFLLFFFFFMALPIPGKKLPSFFFFLVNGTVWEATVVYILRLSWVSDFCTITKQWGYAFPVSALWLCSSRRMDLKIIC